METNNIKGTEKPLEEKGIQGKGLEPYQLRVIEERTELIDKITKLHAFMGSNFYERLDETTQNHFEEQEKAMKDYCDALLKRINRFEGKLEFTVIPLTFGEKAVGYNFNPSKQNNVDTAKQLMAKAIDLLEYHHNTITDNGKAMSSWTRNVLRTAAFTAIIAAQTALVKYLTWND
jgi:hypothetical protein